MSVESRSATDHWAVGADDVFDAVKVLSAQGRPAYVLHLSTPTLPSTARPFASPDEENRILRTAWETVLSELPRTVIGKRQSWRDFIFLLQESREEAIAQAQAIVAALEQGRTPNKLVWRLILSPVTASWDHALRLSEPEEYPLTATAQRAIAVLAEGALEAPRLTVIVPQCI